MNDKDLSIYKYFTQKHIIKAKIQESPLYNCDKFENACWKRLFFDFTQSENYGLITMLKVPLSNLMDM